MQWKLLAVLACALMTLPAAPVFAQDDEAEEPAETATPSEDGEEECCDHNGWYVGLGGGYAMEFFEDGSAGDSGIVNLRAGYRFLDFGAIEVMGEYTPKFNGHTGDYGLTDVATWAAWLDFKGYPLARWTGLVQPYALVGVAWMWERRTGPAVSGSDEDGGFAARFGGGVDVYITPHIFLTADAAYVLPTGNLENLKQVQIGGALGYRF